MGAGQSAFELVELLCADAARADANGGGLACDVAFFMGQVPLAGVVQLGEAACAVQVGAHGDSLGALCHHLPVQIDLRFEADEVAVQTGGHDVWTGSDLPLENE